MKRTCLLAAIWSFAGCSNQQQFGQPDSQFISHNVHNPSGTDTQVPALVWVNGEFQHRGSFPWTNGITVADAMSLAGGFNRYAKGRTLILLHWDGTIEVYRLTRHLEFKDRVFLRPGDSVSTPVR